MKRTQKNFSVPPAISRFLLSFRINLPGLTPRPLNPMMVEETIGEQLDLFALDIHYEITEEQVQQALQKVIAQAKKAGNHDSFHVYGAKGRLLDMSTTNMLPELEKRGYLQLWNNGRRCHLFQEYRDWHDPKEIADAYRDLCLQALANGRQFL
ncbi:hypothetical protein ACFQ88_22305 [Paenibacillus sp. NPDC056579]|uniref:hypothetical protein n=1 Tax=Paenibacillus sp. NPDC056579 TaxID=3345871 RepID=UPI0036CAE658